MLKQLILMWCKENRKKKEKLEAFWKLEDRDGSVTMKDLASEIGEIIATTYLWRRYCMKNGIIEHLPDASIYNITDFGKTLIGVENE